jgi:hypothetical protein
MSFSRIRANATQFLAPVWWLLLVLLSLFVWLGVSSVLAGAVHSLAKSNFSAHPFGSISLWALATAILWPAFVAYIAITFRWIHVNRLILDMSLVAAWALGLTAVTAISDQFLNGLGIAAVAVWLIEIAAAMWLLYVTLSPLSLGTSVQGRAISLLTTLAWLTEAKALLLCLSPGITVRI